MDKIPDLDVVKKEKKAGEQLRQMHALFDSLPGRVRRKMRRGKKESLTEMMKRVEKSK